MTKPIVLCFGNSNTHGTMPIADWAERGRYAYEDRWSTQLETLTGTQVIAEGLPGRTTVHDDPIEGEWKNGLRALPILLETHRPIDLIVLMLGTNDCKKRFSLGPEDIARSVDRLLGSIAASVAGPDGNAPPVIVVSPAPLEETGLLAGIFDGGAAKSQALAGPLAEVAKARGADFLDAGQHATVSDIDGVHLTPDGHSVLAKALAPMVSNRLASLGSA